MLYSYIQYFQIEYFSVSDKTLVSMKPQWLSLLLSCSLATMALGCPIGGIDFTGKIISGIWKVEKEQE